MENYSEGLATGMALTQGNNGGFGFGNNSWGELIGLIVVAGLFGFGNFGAGRGGYGGGIGENYALATDFATIERKLDGVNNGLCDGFYAMNTGMLNGFAGVQQTLCQGFSGVNASITDVGYSIKDCLKMFLKAIKNKFTKVKAIGSFA